MSIDYLAIKNAHIRDKNISFEEEGHKYTVNGETDYTSVTTWIHSFIENFNTTFKVNNLEDLKKLIAYKLCKESFYSTDKNKEYELSEA